MNYFSPRTAAERYAKGRPYHHDLIVERIRDTIELGGHIPLALDVACGTGMSCTALKAIAERVIGLDAASEMLALAPKDERIVYLEGAAESLPVRDGGCDFMTVSSAFHWFDRSRFFPEAKRVLRPNGWLILYNNVFPGIMRDVPDFTPWLRHYYAKQYPSPPRNWKPLEEDEAGEHGFIFVGTDRFENEVDMLHEQLVDYMLTQSNVIAAVEKGGEDIDAVHGWLLTYTQQFFDEPSVSRALVFGTTVWYLREQHQ